MTMCEVMLQIVTHEGDQSTAMIHHVSFAAEDPQRAARAVAELWGGKAFPFPFPPVARGSR